MYEQFDYCNFENRIDITNDILSFAFTISQSGKEKITAAYKEFSENFHERSPASVQMTISKHELNPIASDTNFNAAFNDPSAIIGIDLPVFIKRSKSVCKTIMIVGQDPLRGAQNINQEIIFSTPYATHDNNYEDCNGRHHKSYKESHGKLYWTMAKHILDNNFALYYTDITKIWMRIPPQKKSIKIPLELRQRFQECILKEINIIQPVAIITFGLVANVEISKILTDYTDITLIPFIHPSPAANGSWAKVVSQLPNGEKLSFKKEAYLLREINKFLNI